MGAVSPNSALDNRTAYCLIGMLLRFFVHFYDMEIIEEEAFLAWKEDITQEFPGKGKALFQVNVLLVISVWVWFFVLFFNLHGILHPIVQF